ncbi:MAG TPA: flippase [Thermoanaerobaculia bacterium]|nr:flippase [Thermoanaerobaculia bacterium]
MPADPHVEERRGAALWLLANGLAMLAARLLPPLFAFGINVGIGRVLGAETLGVYIHLVALLLIFQTLATAGIPLLLTREISARPEETATYLSRARSFALACGTLSTLGFTTYAVWLLPGSSLLPALLLATTLPPSAFMAIQEAYFMARRAHHWLTLVTLAENALKLGLAVATFVLGGGILGLCASIAVARLAALGLGSRMMRAEGASGAFRPRLSEVLGFGRIAAPFAAMMTLSMLYFRLDILLVERVLGERATGIYGAALTLYSAALLLPSSAMSAIYPRLASLFRNSPDGYARAARLSARLLGLAITPVALALIYFAGPILRLSYGHRFAAAAPILRLLAASLPLHAINGALGQALQAGHFQRAMLRVVVVGVVANGAFNLALLPRLGIEGAALAVFASATVVVIGACICFHRQVARFALSARTVLSAFAALGPAMLVLVSPRWQALGLAMAALIWLAAVVSEGFRHRTNLAAASHVEPLPRSLAAR